MSRNVIYAIICKRCAMAYIGETGRRLADRFCEHLYSIKNHSGHPVDVHFNSTGHRGVQDIQVTTIKSCFSDDRTRLALENRYIYLYGTLKPDGINERLSHI